MTVSKPPAKRCIHKTAANAQCRRNALLGAAHCAQHAQRLEERAKDSEHRMGRYRELALFLKHETQVQREYIEELGRLVKDLRTAMRSANIRFVERRAQNLVAAQREAQDAHKSSIESERLLPASKRRVQKAAEAMLTLR